MKKAKVISNLVVAVIALLVVGFAYKSLSNSSVPKHSTYPEIHSDQESSVNSSTSNVSDLETSLNKEKSYESDFKVEGFGFKIINESSIPGVKYSFDIRLNEKTSTKELTKIANHLRSQLGQEYEKIFIVYYLPGMKIGSGGWATSHFDPSLEVNILGLTKESEEAIFDDIKLEDDSRKVIGRWRDETPYLGCIITMFSIQNSYYIEKRYFDGGVEVLEYSTKRIDGVDIYFDVKGNDFGEFITIDNKGDLSFYDNQGWIYSATKVL